MLSTCLLCFGVAASTAQEPRHLPKIQGESLAGHVVTLPDNAASTVAVLIFGFSKASKTPTSAWAHKLMTDEAAQTGFEVYQLPVLEAVPRLVRGMVISGIKKGVPQAERDHFVPILQKEAELKTFVNYHEPDDAYLVVLNRAGEVIDITHGNPDEASYARLRVEIERLLR